MAEIIEYPTNEQVREVYKQYKRALASGQLVKATACAWCGETKLRIHGHHPDYARPLMVVWLCARCHRQHHAQYGLERWLTKQGF